MITFRSSRWTLAGPAMLLALAGAPCVAEEPQAQERREKRFETKVVVVDGEGRGEHLPLLAFAADHDLECTEENGRKVCVSKIGLGHPFNRTFLGVGLTESTPELREHLGAPREAGVLVSKVEEESPAAQAGIRVGDIVTAVDGERVESARDLRRAIASREAGDTVAIELYRDGRLEQLSATLARREPPDFGEHFRMLRPMIDGEAISERVREALEGIDFEDLNAEVRKQLDAVDWEAIREAVREALDQELQRER